MKSASTPHSALMLSGALFLPLLVGCSLPEPTRFGKPTGSAEQPSTIEPRTSFWPTFPCSQCHAKRKVDKRQRELVEFHTIRNEFSHGAARGWCYRCHFSGDLNKLVVDGNPVSFNEPYKLCGSCHGSKLQDWRKGIHALTVGYWDGPRVRRSCTGCHDPHGPRFGQMVAESSPERPRTIETHD